MKETDKIASRDAQLFIDGGVTANEFTFTMKDGKRMLKRVMVDGGRLA